MKLIRKWDKILALAALLSLFWTQTVVAGHDQLHQHPSEDCVICKVVETSNDKVDVKENTQNVEAASDTVALLVKSELSVSLWRGNRSSRAPPASF